ncbi:hypothetical protein [Anaerosporobacter faecicola]|uniref:hypothetical protein n=1 Tax=Anaerosporobacter faecicola TaxID=2718714 RepID=UPI00143C4DF1|nr:hypothetical protein [Anaerosporobacter faecicola]
MTKAFNYIVWGLIFATFHINLGSLQILPSFVGWIFVAIGIRQMIKVFDEQKLKMASHFSELLALITAVELVAPVFGFSSTTPFLGSIIVSVAEFMFIYRFFQGITTILLNTGKIQLAGDNEKMLRNYLICHIVGIIAMGIMTISYDNTLDGILAIYMIVLRIYITYRMNKTGKFFLPQEPLRKFTKEQEL